jgi:predicted DNA-binding protein (MmcQ/YjbR family)
MNIEEFRSYCLSKEETQECFPFGENTLVFKVAGKMFALTSLAESEFSVNLKCDPAIAIELREEYPAVQPGYHMNKKHWNTVYIDSSAGDHLIKKWIDHSYDLVVLSLPKKIRDHIKLRK